MGIPENRQVGRQSGEAEENGHEEACDQTAQSLIDLPGQDRRFANQHACDKRSKHAVHPNQMRDQRHATHQQQDDADDRGRADETVVSPPNEPEHQAPPDREADGQKCEGAQDRLSHGIDVERSV